MPSTRTRSLDAAIELLGTEGLRALTHARVDERARLPKGSTSNHFRTRAALLAGTADWVAERELAELGTTLAPTSVSDLVDALVTLVDLVTVRNHTLTAARLVLFMEAAHDDALREHIVRGRAAMESWFVPILAGLGAKDPQAAGNALAACLEGVVLHRIARHDESDPRPVIELVVRAAVG